MNTICWQAYPFVDQTELARTWLEIQSRLQLAPKTIDAYGRSLNDFPNFCTKQAIEPAGVAREQVALYVQDLATRPNPRVPRSLLFPLEAASRTAPCSNESRSYGYSVIISLKNNSGQTIRLVVVTTCRGKGLLVRGIEAPSSLSYPTLDSLRQRVAEHAPSAQGRTAPKSGHAASRLRWSLTARRIGHARNQPF